MTNKIRKIDDILNNIIDFNDTLGVALERLDYIKMKVLFVVDDNMTLCGTVTDGDARRAIIGKVGLDTPVIDIANRNPRYVTNEDVVEIQKIISREMITAVPVLDEHGRILKIFCEKKSVLKNKRELKNVPVVIMAGGLGTRLYPYTRILPKPLIPVADKPICERIIDGLNDEGCDVFNLIVNYKKKMIKSYFEDIDHEYKVEFWDEDEPLGTGGGLKLVENVIDGTFILTNCDIIILEEVSKIVKYHKEQGNDATIVCSLMNYEIPYGVVDMDDEGLVASFTEKPKMSFLANTGYYILEPNIFGYIDINEKIGVPDILERMKKDNKRIGVYPIHDDMWMDMGQFDSMEAMERRIIEAGLNSDME